MFLEMQQESFLLGNLFPVAKETIVVSGRSKLSHESQPLHRLTACSYTERPKKPGTQMNISFLREEFLLVEKGYYVDRR